MDEDLRQKDLSHVWHPYTQTQTYAEHEPTIIEEVHGRRLKDSAGDRYWDGVSGIWPNVHRHRVREIDSAIRDQLNDVARPEHSVRAFGEAGQVGIMT